MEYVHWRHADDAYHDLHDKRFAGERLDVQVGLNNRFSIDASGRESALLPIGAQTNVLGQAGTEMTSLFVAGVIEMDPLGAMEGCRLVAWGEGPLGHDLRYVEGKYHARQVGPASRPPKAGAQILDAITAATITAWVGGAPKATSTARKTRASKGTADAKSCYNYTHPLAYLHISSPTNS